MSPEIVQEVDNFVMKVQAHADEVEEDIEDVEEGDESEDSEGGEMGSDINQNMNQDSVFPTFKFRIRS